MITINVNPHTSSFSSQCFTQYKSSEDTQHKSGETDIVMLQPIQSKFVTVEGTCTFFISSGNKCDSYLAWKISKYSLLQL